MNRYLSLALLTLALVLGGGFWLVRQAPVPTVHGQTLTLPGAASAETTQAGEVQEMVLGNPDASVEIVEYASFTCPHCANFHAGPFKDLKAEYIDTGKVKFVYREVYFDKYGMWASLVARCEPAKFFGIADMVYKTQGTWARAGSDGAIAEELRKIGRLAGLNDDQLNACLSDGTKLRSLVEWYQANAEKDGINSTPSFVINGTKYQNMAWADFKNLIETELAN